MKFWFRSITEYIIERQNGIHTNQMDRLFIRVHRRTPNTPFFKMDTVLLIEEVETMSFEQSIPPPFDSIFFLLKMTMFEQYILT